MPYKLVMCVYHTVLREKWFLFFEKVIFFDQEGSFSGKHKKGEGK